jgi:hypothetical protein
MERKFPPQLRIDRQKHQADLVKAAIAAVHALRSYQYGNSSPELAEEIADALEAAIEAAISRVPVRA